jgi:hypothetical protein
VDAPFWYRIRAIGLDGTTGPMSLPFEARGPANGTLTNGDFEPGTIGPWLGLNGFETAVEGAARSGTYALRLAGPQGGGVEQLIVGLLPDQRYRFSGWLRAGDWGGGVVLGVRGAGEASADLTSQTVTGSTYEACQVTFTTGSSQTSATVFVARTMDGNVYDVFADDLILEAIAP